MTKDDLYAAMDALHAQAAPIEQAVFFHTADLFKLEVDLLFYDTTPCTFAIDEDEEDDSSAASGGPRTGHGHRKWGWRSPSPARDCRCASIGVAWQYPRCHHGRAHQR